MLIVFVYILVMGKRIKMSDIIIILTNDIYDF